jgi:hypothetical protein
MVVKTWEKKKRLETRGWQRETLKNRLGFHARRAFFGDIGNDVRRAIVAGMSTSDNAGATKGRRWVEIGWMCVRIFSFLNSIYFIFIVLNL